MAQWYFKIGGYELPPPDQLGYELYPQSDLIRLADYSMTGRFIGTAEKFIFNYDTMLESDRDTLFRNIMGYNAQNAWLTGNRKFIYRMDELFKNFSRPPLRGNAFGAPKVKLVKVAP